MKISKLLQISFNSEFSRIYLSVCISLDFVRNFEFKKFKEDYIDTNEFEKTIGDSMFTGL